MHLLMEYALKMKMAEKKPTKTEIRIYQSLWKNLLLGIGCMAFAVGGCMIIRDNNCDLATKIIGGWGNVVFFGGGGLFLTVITLYNKIRHIPFLIIHEDRLELYEQHKGTYYNINFTDVKKFRLLNDYSPKTIAIDYKNSSLVHKFEKSSDFKQRLMTCNFKHTGAIENIPVHNLTMKGNEICVLLNRRLKNTEVTKA